MSISELIEFFKKGYTPSQLVRMGYPKSTVYYAYKKYRILHGRPTVYIAYDVDDPLIVYHVAEALARAGVEPVAGGLGHGTLEKLVKSDIVLAVELGQGGVRSELFAEELSTARRLKKPLILITTTCRRIHGTATICLDRPSSVTEGLWEANSLYGERGLAVALAALSAVAPETFIAVTMLLLRHYLFRHSSTTSPGGTGGRAEGEKDTHNTTTATCTP